MDAEYQYHLLRKSCRMISDYFEKEIFDHITNNKVPVLVKDFVTSFYYLECDDNGYPKRRETSFISVSSPISLSAFDGASPFVENIQVMRKTVLAERPMIVQQWNDPYTHISPSPRVFLWEGKLIENKEIPIEQLDVKKLQHLAQEAIKSRDGIYLDDVLKNKMIK